MWWDKDIEEIEELMPILFCSDLEKVKDELKDRLSDNDNKTDNSSQYQ